MRKLAVLALGTLLVACGDAQPIAVEDSSPPVAMSRAKSMGAPMIDRSEFSAGPFPFFCQTFMGEVTVEVKSTFWFWENADGSVRFKFHDQARNTFTNLDTGEFVVADFLTNLDATVSADGNVIEERASGPFLKVKKNGVGKAIAFEIGHRTFSLDLNAMPPVVEQTFNGRADFGAGPCVDLGDPPPAP